MAYSDDLKQRIRAYLAAGGSKVEAAKLFSVARATVYLWLGQPADHQRRKPGPKTGYKIDRAKLARLVEEHPDMLLRERADLMGASTSGIHHALKALKITHKKNTALRTSLYARGGTEA
jgi:transposase